MLTIVSPPLVFKKHFISNVTHPRFYNFPADSCGFFSFEIIMEMPELCRLTSMLTWKKVETHHTSFILSPRVNMMDNNYKTQWVKKIIPCEHGADPCGLILVKLKPLAHYRAITDFIISQCLQCPCDFLSTYAQGGSKC